MAAATDMLPQSYAFLPDEWSAPAGDFSILHELNLVSGSYDSPASSFDSIAASAPSRKRRPDAAAPPAKRHCAKPELLFATEPVTPSGLLPPSPAPLPGSPAAASACSDEELEPMAPARLPAPSAAEAARRRALRAAHLKRARRRQTGAERAAKREPDAVFAGADQPDKKAARAIRNRAAAMKSRVEAKARMQKLEDDNARLNGTVARLTESNRALAEQIERLTAGLVPGATPGAAAELLAIAAGFQDTAPLASN